MLVSMKRVIYEPASRGSTAEGRRRSGALKEASSMEPKAAIHSAGGPVRQGLVVARREGVEPQFQAVIKIQDKSVHGCQITGSDWVFKTQIRDRRARRSS